MTPRTVLLGCLLAIPAVLGTVHPGGAQDVLLQGKHYGIEPPAGVLEALRQDPHAFEFRRVWIEKARGVRRARIGLESSLGPEYTAADLARSGGSLTGTLRLPVLAARFSDSDPTYTSGQYWERLFGGGSGAVSVSELYEEMSGGLFAVAGSVSDWIPLPNLASYYEPSPETDPKFGRAFEFLTDLLVQADPGVDFSLFDNDGPDGIPNSGDDDGFVDVLSIIYPTKPNSCGGPGIWPHRFTYEDAGSYFNEMEVGPFETNDPAAGGGFIYISDYTVQSGLSCDTSEIMGTGTFSHILGHGLGLPDLYDTTPQDDPDSEGIGEWGLMGAGRWNTESSPAHMSAWSKDFLGWLDVRTPPDAHQITYLTPIQDSRMVIRLDLPDSDEYFLLSYRTPGGSDAYLPGQGLLIWHIDDAVAGGLDETRNRVNADVNHKGVDLEEADGLDELDRKDNRGDAGDPFPGSSNRREFHALSYPNSQAYGGTPCGIGIRDIRELDGAVGFSLTVGERSALWGDANGENGLDGDDRNEIFWYALGYRDAVEQEYIGSGDLDGDGDVDIRDGFILHSHLEGISAPGSRVGESFWADCDPSTSPPALVGAEGIPFGSGNTIRAPNR